MYTFALNGRCNHLSALGGTCSRSVLELGCFPVESRFDLCWVGMFEFLVLDACHLVGVLLWKNLSILNWLNGGVVMILVNLSVNRGGDLLLADGLNLLMLDGWCLSLIDNGFMVTSSSDELGDRCFGSIHAVGDDWLE